MTTARLHTPRLDALESTLKTIARGLEIVPEVGGESARKLEWLARAQRDLLAPTYAMESSALRFARQRVSEALRAGRMATALEIVEAMGQGVRAHVLLLSREGGGGSFRPLTRRYEVWKRRRYPGRPITQATRALYNELARAPWKARRK